MIIDKSKRIIIEEKTKVQSEAKLFRSVTETVIIKNRNEIDSAKKFIIQHSLFLLKTNNGYVNYYNDQVFKSSIFKLSQNSLILQQLKDNLSIQCSLKYKNDILQLDNFERNLRNLDPINILRRGFSITLHNGKSIKDISQVTEGELIETKVFNGQIFSVIKSKK